MKIASFAVDSRESFGPVIDDMLLDAAPIFSGRAGSLRAVLAHGLLDELRLLEPGAVRAFNLVDVELRPPVPRPGKTICVGINYLGRPGEFGNSNIPKYPSLFMRGPTAQVGHLQTVLRPPESVQLDYEGEIALIIGTRGRRISRERALSHVAGYTCYNEGSIRDWMRHGAYNVTAGKNFDSSGACGPWMVTSDEIADPRQMSLETRVNGVIVQSDTTNNMIRSFEELIEYISTFTTLEPGDVIVTGTPTGTASKMSEPKWLKAGDVLEVSVGGIGTLRNMIGDEIVESQDRANQSEVRK